MSRSPVVKSDCAHRTNPNAVTTMNVVTTAQRAGSIAQSCEYSTKNISQDCVSRSMSWIASNAPHAMRW